jgi:SOS-response transcriptional repressor LexA
MNEKQTDGTVRPTKKQRELLSYIEAFIGEHGYSPSYREIMNGLSYTSVATVSLHVNSLIRRGHLRKRDRSARSLEVVNSGSSPGASGAGPLGSGADDAAGAAWLVRQTEQRIKALEAAAGADETLRRTAEHLVRALEVLEQSAALSFADRLARLAPETVEANEQDNGESGT